MQLIIARLLCAEDADGLEEEEETQEGEEEGDMEAGEDGTEYREDDRPMGLGRATALAKLPRIVLWGGCC